MQRHRLPDGPPQHNQRRRNQQRNLDARADGHAHSQVHLVLDGDHTRRDVLSSVANNGDQNQPDKRLADLTRRHQRVDAVHHVISAHRDDERRHDEHQPGGPRPQQRLLLVLLARRRGLRLGLKQLLVRAQREVEVQHVEQQQDHGGAAREDEDAGLLVVLVGLVEHAVQRGGEDHRGRGERHERARRLRGALREALLPAAAVGAAHVVDAAEEEAHAEDEQQVGQDGPQHRGLHDLDLAGAQRDDADDELDGVSKGRVDQPAERLAQAAGDLLGRERQHGGQRDDGEEVEGKHPGGAPFLVAGDDAQRDEHEEQVDPGWCGNLAGVSSRAGGINVQLNRVTLVTFHTRAGQRTKGFGLSVPGLLWVLMRRWRQKPGSAWRLEAAWCPRRGLRSPSMSSRLE